jgi:hypothetical protein
MVGDGRTRRVDFCDCDWELMDFGAKLILGNIYSKSAIDFLFTSQNLTIIMTNRTQVRDGFETSGLGFL